MTKKFRDQIELKLASILICSLMILGCQPKMEESENTRLSKPITKETSSTESKSATVKPKPITGNTIFSLADVPEGKGLKFSYMQIKETTNEGIVLIATKPDPRIYLPELDYKNVKSLTLEIDLTPATKSVCQVFYLTSSNENYDANHRETVDVIAGRQTVTLTIDDPYLTGSLRLDLGNAVGVYTLHGLTISAN